jgi:DNA primase
VATIPETTWTDQARIFLEECQRDLWGIPGTDCRGFLFERGLKTETIKSSGLGWNANDRYQSRESWGLPLEQRGDDRPREIWLPAGLVIPSFDRERIVRLKIRRFNPEKEGRYIFISGSSSVPMSWGSDREKIILVESELDGLLIAQEAGDLVGVVAMGSAQIRPDLKTDEALKEADLILVALDSDQAGKKESWGFWKKSHITSGKVGGLKYVNRSKRLKNLWATSKVAALCLKHC